MISPELEKILKKAGVDPHLYDTEKTGIRQDFEMPFRMKPDEHEFDKIYHKPKSSHKSSHKSEPTLKKDKTPKTLDIGPLQQEDHGMGYSHNVSSPEDQNTMNKSTIGSLKEYHDPNTRLKSVSSVDEDRALKMIFHWTKNNQIDYDEFETLLAGVVKTVIKKLGNL